MFTHDKSTFTDPEHTGLHVVRHLQLVSFFCFSIKSIGLRLILTMFIRTHILSDPTGFEEPLLDTTLSIVLGDENKLISVSQLGLGSAGSQDALMSCIAAAKQRHWSLANHILTKP